MNAPIDLSRAPRIPRQKYRPDITAVVFLLYAAGIAVFIATGIALWGKH